MDSPTTRRKPWAVLAYTVADDRGTGDALDGAAKEELRSLCDAADFGQMSVAAQVDFKHLRVLAQPLEPPRVRARTSERRHAIAALDEPPRERGADKAGCAGYERAGGHAASSSATAWRCVSASSGR